MVFLVHSLWAQDYKKPDISGFTEIDHISYFNPQSGKINSRNQGILQLELSGKTKSVSYFGALEFRNDLSDSDRNRVWTDELYITYKAKNFDLNLGKKIYTWGSTDSFSPVNVINPIDYSDLLDTDNETIGVYSAGIKYYFNQNYLEGIFIPVFEPSRVPGTNSRWLPSQPQTAKLSEKQVPIVYQQNFDILPEKDIRSHQFGARFGGALMSIDYNLNYFRGYDDIPYFHRYPQPSIDTLMVELTKQYHKINQVGVDLMTVVGGMVLKAEWAYINQEAPTDQPWFMGAPYHYAVIGLDKNISDFIGDIDVFLTAQYIYQNIRSDYEVTSFNFNHIFQNALMGKMNLSLTNRLKVETTFVYDFKADHYLIMPEINLKPDDGFILSFKSYLTGGSEDALFGSYQNNRIQFIARYDF